ncbi:O-antigen polymerase [Parasphingorhabdus sp.]|uniref:O-antigen polymerase n=1 Tax=Parasphingorhabdus sp. TaxID=2709688 RepID=UPI003D27AC89
MWYLLLFSVILFTLAWLRGRPKGIFFPSDTFAMGMIIFLGVTPLVNPLGSNVNEKILIFSDEIAQSAMFGLSVGFLICAGCWMFRPKLNGQNLIAKFATLRNRNVDSTLFRQSFYSFLALILIVLLLYGSGDYLSYKIRVIEFLTGNLSNSEYAYARRIEFREADIGINLANRLRFTLLPLLTIMSSYFLFRKFGLFNTLMVLAIITIVGAASLSKLPMIFFTIYIILAIYLMSSNAKYLSFRYISLFVPVSLIVILIFLTASYFLQYSSIYNSFSDIGPALDVAFYRLFTATYAGMLGHFKIYPEILPFSGVNSIGLIGSLLGDARNTDFEVAQHFLGYDRGRFTTFPTGYIGGAFASFGIVGIVLYSVIISVYFAFADRLVLMLKNPLLSLALYTSIVLNCIFLVTLNAPAVFLTYGLLLNPVFCIVADRIMSYRRSNSNRRSSPLNKKRTRRLRGGFG